MKFNEVLEESKLNSWTKLKVILDRIFGFNSNENTKVKRIKQSFDQSTGEHVIYLEYRAKARNQSPISKNPDKVKLTKEQSNKKA